MKNMSPIVVNARFLSQKVTGVQRFAQEISLQLKQQVEGIRFVCPHDVRQEALAAELGAEIVGKRIGHPWEQWDLPRELRQRENPLLINLMSTAPIIYKNQIATLHDINFVRFPKSYSRSFGLFYRFLIPMMLKRIRMLLTVSNFSKKEISQYYKIREDLIKVIENAVSENMTSPQHLKKNKINDGKIKYVLAVSSTNYHKNFQRLVDAFIRLPEGDQTMLYVVGEESASFRANEISVHDHPSIKFLGRVTDPELVSLYQGASVFAFPSLYEGFGIPPLEAQANGCPVVASNMAAIPEVLKDSAIYFDPLDIDAMTRALHAVLNNESLRGDLIQKGYTNVARFSWEKSARSLISVIGEAMFDCNISN